MNSLKYKRGTEIMKTFKDRLNSYVLNDDYNRCAFSCDSHVANFFKIL